MADGPGFVPRRLRGKGPGNGRGKAGSGICGNGQGPQLPGSCMGGQHIRERTAHLPNPADCPAPPSPRGRHGVPVGIRPRDASRTERVLAAAATAKNLSTAAVPSVGPGTDGVARESCSLWEQVRRFEELPATVTSLLVSRSRNDRVFAAVAAPVVPLEQLLAERYQDGRACQATCQAGPAGEEPWRLRPRRLFEDLSPGVKRTLSEGQRRVIDRNRLEALRRKCVRTLGLGSQSSTLAVASVGTGTDVASRDPCSLWEQVRRFEELPTSVPSLLASHSAVHNLEQDLLSICQEGEDEVLPHPSTSAGEAAGSSVSSVVNTGCLQEQVRRFEELQTASEGGSV